MRSSGRYFYISVCLYRKYVKFCACGKHFLWIAEHVEVHVGRNGPKNWIAQNWEVWHRSCSEIAVKQTFAHLLLASRLAKTSLY